MAVPENSPRSRWMTDWLHSRCPDEHAGRGVARPAAWAGPKPARPAARFRRLACRQRPRNGSAPLSRGRTATQIDARRNQCPGAQRDWQQGLDARPSLLSGPVGLRWCTTGLPGPWRRSACSPAPRRWLSLSSRARPTLPPGLQPRGPPMKRPSGAAQWSAVSPAKATIVSSNVCSPDWMTSGRANY